MPSTSSNSTAEPTASSMRGSTLTCARRPPSRSRISSTTPSASVRRRGDDDPVRARASRDQSGARCRAVEAVDAVARSSGSVATTRAWARLLASFSRMRSASSGSPITRQRSTRRRRAGQPARQHAPADDRHEAAAPTGRPICDARRGSPSSRTGARIVTHERVQPRELQQQRRLVERRVHEPHLVAVVEPGDLEQQDDERHPREHDRAQLRAARQGQDDRDRERGREHVPDPQEASMQSLPVLPGGRGVVEPLDDAETRPPLRGAVEDARVRGPRAGDVRFVEPQCCSELWRHAFTNRSTPRGGASLLAGTRTPRRSGISRP